MRKARSKLTTTKIPTIAAAIAKPLSNPLTPAGRATGRWGTVAGRGGAAAACGRAGGAAGGGGAVGAAAETGAAVELGAATVGGAAAAAGEGILIVGEVVGLGGRLIRTVSFFGCTLAASAGLGGAAPAGGFEFSSAIL